MALLRRAGLFGVDTDGAVIRRAVTVEDLEAAYGLVHETFTERGYIRPKPGGLRIRPFEALPAMATFLADADGRVVGIQGLAVDDQDLGLPSDGAFKAEIDGLRRGGRLVCEATNQAVDPDYRKTAVATELMRAMFAHALLVGCDELITTVSPGHARFFELLGFEKASPVRSYSDELDDPTVLMRVNVSQLIQWVENADDRSDAAALFIKLRCLVGNPYREQVAAWADEARAAFEDPWALQHLFVERAELPARLSDEERAVIRNRWGAEVFDLAVAAPATYAVG
jgi:GNAT superfamily N-acetyltransferase